MGIQRTTSRPVWLPTFTFIALGLLLQACNTLNIEKGAISVDCKNDGKDSKAKPCEGDEDCSEGCAPGSSASGKSALGFFGVGGANPVPAGYTCSSGTLCANPGATGCNLRIPAAKCTNTYTYSTGACNCACK